MAQMLTHIAGVQFRQGAAEALQRIPYGTGLLLMREPSNKFDPNAVAICTNEGLQLGYVPRQDAPAVAKVIDTGGAVECQFAGIRSVSITWGSSLQV